MTTVPLIEVFGDPVEPGRGIVRWRGHEARCALGPAGIRREKREGDGVTPAGLFPFRRVLYRADHGAAPTTGLPVARIEQEDGWCDAPDDPAYNLPVRLPYAASHERMWRDDDLYDLVVVIGHNDEPVVAGAGSAIFVHLAKPDYSPTAGCIALAREDLLALLRSVNRHTLLRIAEPPA